MSIMYYEDKIRERGIHMKKAVFDSGPGPCANPGPATSQPERTWGPKPSVNIAFTGADSGVFYATLLSETSSTGPASAWEGEGQAIASMSPATLSTRSGRSLWPTRTLTASTSSRRYGTVRRAGSSTGHITLPTPSKCSSISGQRFLLLHGIYERYAFDSYYTVDLANFAPGEVLTAVRSYDYTWEIISLLARTAATILLELLVALAFGYRGRKLFLFLTAVNVLTQILLNLALNLVKLLLRADGLRGGLHSGGASCVYRGGDTIRKAPAPVTPGAPGNAGQGVCSTPSPRISYPWPRATALPE